MLRTITPTLRLLRTAGYLVWVLLSNSWNTVVWGNVHAGSVALAIAAGAAAAVRGWRRSRQPPGFALCAWLFGAWLFWWVITRRDERLGALSFDYADLSALATVALLLAVLVWLALRRLIPTRLLLVAAAAVLFWVLEFQALLSEPLSPLFGLLGAEAVLLSVSIFLTVMAASNRFALNEDGDGFPRIARALLYFG